jgi:hypothetical protein
VIIKYIWTEAIQKGKKEGRKERKKERKKEK